MANCSNALQLDVLLIGLFEFICMIKAEARHEILKVCVLEAVSLLSSGLCFARCLLLCCLLLQDFARRCWHLRTLRNLVIFLEVVAHLLHRNPFYAFMFINVFDDSAKPRISIDLR